MYEYSLSHYMDINRCRICDKYIEQSNYTLKKTHFHKRCLIKLFIFFCSNDTKHL